MEEADEGYIPAELKETQSFVHKHACNLKVFTDSPIYILEPKLWIKSLPWRLEFFIVHDIPLSLGE